jgi:hypothetical protein
MGWATLWAIFSQTHLVTLIFIRPRSLNPETNALISLSYEIANIGIGHKRQGCQMAYFKTKNSNLGKFWRVLQWKLLVYFVAIWSILRSFGIFCSHLAYFMVVLYIFPNM